MGLSPQTQMLAARAHAVRERGLAMPPEGLPSEEILDNWVRCMQAGLDSVAAPTVPVVEAGELLRGRRSRSPARTSCSPSEDRSFERRA